MVRRLFFKFGYKSFFTRIKLLENATIIDFFKQENEREIRRYYEGIRPKFMNWLKSNYAITDEADARDIYQRSFTVLYTNAKKGKLDSVEATVETYLFGVGKFIVQEWNRKRNGNLYVLPEASEPNEKEIINFSNVFEQVKLDDSLVQKMQKALKTLGGPCEQIIKLYYWENNSMEAIARKTGYKNEHVAKKKKYACLQKLKKIMGQE